MQNDALNYDIVAFYERFDKLNNANNGFETNPKKLKYNIIIFFNTKSSKSCKRIKTQ